MVALTARLNSGFARFGRMVADTGQIVWVLVKAGWGGVGVRLWQTRRGAEGGVGEWVPVVLEVLDRQMDGQMRE